MNKQANTYLAVEAPGAERSAVEDVGAVLLGDAVARILIREALGSKLAREGHV